MYLVTKKGNLYGIRKGKKGVPAGSQGLVEKFINSYLE